MILGFDTATRATTVALWDPPAGAVEHAARDDPARGEQPRHTTRLLPLIVELLDRADVGWGQIERIAVGVGPGTFTGLRIGVATARALCRALEIPLVGVSTLESLAVGAQLDPTSVRSPIDAVVAVIDARRGEVFAAGWRIGDSLLERERTPLLAPRALGPEALAALIPGLAPSTLAVGDGAVEFRTILERSGALIPEDDCELHRVNAVDHCRLASGRRGCAPDQVQPEYLRLPDAEIAHRAAGKK